MVEETRLREIVREELWGYTAVDPHSPVRAPLGAVQDILGHQKEPVQGALRLMVRAMGIRHADLAALAEQSPYVVTQWLDGTRAPPPLVLDWLRMRFMRWVESALLLTGIAPERINGSERALDPENDGLPAGRASALRAILAAHPEELPPRVSERFRGPRPTSKAKKRGESGKHGIPLRPGSPG